jgi:hypothetical protein
MSEHLFESLPDAARLWINAADRNLTSEEQRNVLDALGDFISDWSSHGRKVEGEVMILRDRFIVVAAHIPGGDVSGCGIDASVHALGGISRALGFDWAPALDIFFEHDGLVKQVDRGSFSHLAGTGQVDLETIVFDVSLSTLGQFRQGAFARPAHESWHGRVFNFAATV